MRYHNITKLDMLNGQGLRVVLWVSHCEHNCKNCHNPQTHDCKSGVEFDCKAREELLEELNKNYVKGITFSGGDPLSTLNRDEITRLAKEVSERFKDKDIWCYTGYKWDKVKHLEIMEYLDVLVDGKYQEELSVPSPPWCGSSNQRVIDVQKSLLASQVVLYK